MGPSHSRGQLVPPGDFHGKSLSEWTLDWGEWATRTGLSGQSLPDFVDNLHYLPPNFGADFTASLTIPQGAAVLFSPYFLFGEKYDDGSEDLPSAIADFMLFEAAAFRTAFDGSTVLEGKASDFPDRKSGIRTFSPPIPYLVPEDRGGINAIAAIFEQGLGAIFEVPLGQHTITNVFESEFFGGPFTQTYNITVVPEPGSFAGLGACSLGLLTTRRRMRSTRP
jgi:hypothetical protein